MAFRASVVRNANAVGRRFELLTYKQILFGNTVNIVPRNSALRIGLYFKIPPAVQFFATHQFIMG